MKFTKRNSIKKGLLCGATLTSWISPLVLSVILPTHAATSGIESSVKVSNIACTVTSESGSVVSFQLTNLSRIGALIIYEFGIGLEKPEGFQLIRIEPLQTITLNLDSEVYELGYRYQCDGGYTSYVHVHNEEATVFGRIPITA